MPLEGVQELSKLMKARLRTTRIPRFCVAREEPACCFELPRPAVVSGLSCAILQDFMAKHSK